MSAIQASLVERLAAGHVSPMPESRSQINIVLFSGGSGTQSITEAFRRHPQIALKILINAYDDGHSTGRLRRFIPGMLGPSDIRKNINRLMPTIERSQRSLKLVSDYRLPVGVSRKDALAILNCIVAGDYEWLPERLASAFPQFAYWQLRQLCSFLVTFLTYFEKQESCGRTFDFTDCALGNLLFAGCYLQHVNFNRAIESFSEFYEVGKNVLLNITLGENLFLAAEKETGAVLLNEAEIVATQDATRIRELFLLDEETYLTRVENAACPPPGGWGHLLRAAHRVPGLNPGASTALAEADVIVYGPGTQHSSLLPSYMTEGLAETIAQNKKADKIFIANIYRDHDIQQEDAADLARKFLDAMTRDGGVPVQWQDVVSHFFVQGTDENTLSRAKYVTYDKSRFVFPLEVIKVRDWEAEGGCHAGGYVLDELRQIVQSRIDVDLSRVHHMVSVIVPVLNEEATIEAVLRSLTALDFQAFGLTKEIILVDGGSTDRTIELGRSIRNVKVLCAPQRGRGAAMLLGMKQARGNIIVFFPGDGEYRADDLYSIVNSLVNSQFRAAFGTRATKCTDLSQRLKAIYQGNQLLYLTSKYGGLLLSVTTLLLFNRYVSDVLSSVKGYDADLLRSLKLESNGLDLETEIVAKLSKKREYILEIPVNYKPRTRALGKKIRASDGIKAVLALMRYRLCREGKEN
ncbi:MAG TPA: 2-phospho-L-lactate transferase CofD family protein [Terriglobales bacterium]|nr:2-phospho-L-lactate transferase CofD family protein [Terriglobales bacterium]